MTNQQIADSIVLIVKDLNVFVRAANLRNLLVDSNFGNLSGNMVVAISDYIPAIAQSAVEGEAFDEIQKRASALIGEEFKEVDHSALEKITDESSVGQSIDVSLQAATEVAQTIVPEAPSASEAK